MCCLERVPLHLCDPSVARIARSSSPRSTAPLPALCSTAELTLPQRGDEVVCQSYRSRVEIKPPAHALTKAWRQWDRVSVGFKRPVRGARSYLLVAVDKYSRSTFVFLWKHTKSSTIIDCFPSLLCLWVNWLRSQQQGRPICQSGNAELHAWCTSFSSSTAYHPTGNSQCERFDRNIWRTITLLLHGRVVFLMINRKRCWPKLWTLPGKSKTQNKDSQLITWISTETS